MSWFSRESFTIILDTSPPGDSGILVIWREDFPIHPCLHKLYLSFNRKRSPVVSERQRQLSAGKGSLVVSSMTSDTLFFSQSPELEQRMWLGWEAETAYVYLCVCVFSFPLPLSSWQQQFNEDREKGIICNMIFSHCPHFNLNTWEGLGPALRATLPQTRPSTGRQVSVTSASILRLY